MQTIDTKEDALALIATLEAGATRHAVPTGGGRVVWRQWGSGPVLALLHGGHGSWLHWVRNIPALAAQHTLLVPDMPGFGESDDLDGDPHAPDRLDQLADVLTASLAMLVGPSQPIGLAAFSFGAMAASALVARRSVQRLALIGAGGHGTARRQPMKMIDWRLDDPEAMRAALRHNLHALMLRDPAAIDALALEVHQRSCLATRFRSRDISMAGQLRQAFDRLDAPLLLLWGRDDVTGDPEVAGPKMVDGRPQREWGAIEGAGHWAQFERAGDVNQRLLGWFAPEG